MKFSTFHRQVLPLAVLVVASSVHLGCELPPEELIEPDTRVVTLLITGSIRGELEMCD